jgi:prepilin-type N-terminal cleavage/methylation domain-containing protein
MPSIPPACLEERHMKTKAREGGFTLVEIAIVLVIIGLLLGGILKGQELITSARVRNLADQASAVQAAYYGFVDRFHAIPGDMLATQVCGAIGNTVPNCPGAPVGGIGASGGNATIDAGNWAEASAVWSHLSGAGFLQGTYPGNATATTYRQTAPLLAPQNPWGGSLLLARTPDYLDSTTATPAPRLHLIVGGNIPVNVMRELDVKVDDSLPAQGVLRSAKGADASFDVVGEEGTPTCVDTAPTPDIWDINGASVACNAYFLF